MQTPIPQIMARFLRYAMKRIDHFLTAGINPEPRTLYTFNSTKEVERWRVFSDAAFGGSSIANLQLGPNGNVSSTEALQHACKRALCIHACKEPRAP